MNPDEKILEAKDMRNIIHERGLYSEERANEASIEFIRLEVQIATLLLGLTGVFWNLYSSNLKGVAIASTAAIILIKIAFSFILFFLVGSLSVGLIQLKRVEKFWDGVSLTRTVRFNKWHDVIAKKTTFEEAHAYHEGTKIEGGAMIQTPKWPWILQSVFLGISITLIFGIAIAFVVVS
ncbi:MAG: hypothetical protein WCO12_01345 [bacterium]